MTSARATVVAAKPAIGNLGGNWMSGPHEEEATAEAGLEGWQLYFMGRHGVLGDVDPDVITASAVMFPGDVVRHEWTLARRVLTPAEAVSRYAAICHDWGRRRLEGFREAEALSDLGQRIVAAAEPAGLPLFAGWRALPVPDDPLARCAHVLQLLREHRGGCHSLALLAAGLTPLMAILTNQGGEANAAEYGWQPPFPTATDEHRALRERVEQTTDDLAERAYRALEPSEQAEFLTVLDRAHSFAFPHGVPFVGWGTPVGSEG